MERAIFALGSGATGDPCLYVEPSNLPHSFLLDCGNQHLGHARLLRSRFLFLSHNHLDHFIGFDSWMRVHLGSTNTLHIIGPHGTATHVYHKIHGYVWNLAETVYLQFRVTELDPLRSFQLLPQKKFELEEVQSKLPLLDPRQDWNFRHQALQHLSITSIGYRLFTQDQWKVDEDALSKSGLVAGPWIKELKSRESGSIVINEKEHDVADLRKSLLYHSSGYSIAYITDAIYQGENIPKMIELAHGVDHLFCESSFLKQDEDRATRTHHLTTAHAAMIAREACVKMLHLFHFSRRYAGLEHVFLREAREVFPRTVIGTR